MDLVDIVVESVLKELINTIWINAPQGLVTTAIGAIAVLAYRRVTTFRPRHMVLERLRTNLWGAVRTIDNINLSNDPAEREASLDILCAWLEAISKTARSTGNLFSKKHALFLTQISISADIRQSAIARTKAELAEKGMLAVMFHTGAVKKANRKEIVVEEVELVFEYHVLECLYNLNRMLKKYDKHIDYDLTKKMDDEDKKKYKKVWEDGWTALSAT